ncbi:hypothetical protein GH733_000085 [Mirounga leonina]|nr:hypothetical protein GH733_000085 [Mirounga leonina]
MTRSPLTTPAAADDGERPPKTLEVQKNFKVLQLQGLRMLTAEEPTEPAETGCPEEGGGPGADPKDVAVLSGEDGQPEQMLKRRVSPGNGQEGAAGEAREPAGRRRLRACLSFSPHPVPPVPPQLQQQVARLHEALRSQESRWAAAQHQLQSQIDALSRQNRELRDGLKALGLPLPGAREADAAALGTRRKPDALVSRSAFGKMLPLSSDEETLVKHAGRRSRSATVLGQGPSSELLPSSQHSAFALVLGRFWEMLTVENDFPQHAAFDLKSQAQATRRSSRSLQEPRGRNPPEPAMDVVRLKEDRPAAEGNEQTDGSDCSPLGTAEPQNPPVEPGPSHGDAEIKQGDKEEETRPPACEVAQALGNGHEAITFLKGAGKDRGAGKKTTVLRFLNGDVKKILPDQRVVYHYADAQIRRTSYPNGLDTARFPDKQTGEWHVVTRRPSEHEA